MTAVDYMFNCKFLMLKVAFCQLLLSVSLTSFGSPLVFLTIPYPPFSYVVDGKQVGIAVDLVREASARLHQDILIEFIPFVRALHMIQVGEADGVFPFSKDENRLKFALYASQALVEQAPTLFVRSDVDISFDGDLGKLKQFTFGIERGANYGPEFSRAVKDGVVTHIDGAEDQKHNLIKLVRGRFDIAVGPRTVVRFYAKQEGLLREIKELHPSVGKPVMAYLAFSKIKHSQTLVDQYNDVFEQMHKDGTYDRIVRAYSE